ALGVSSDTPERAAALLAADADVLVVDIAHGHSDAVLDACAALRARWPHVELIAGNIATAAGARDLIAAGVDGLKVGVGPGSACTTRIVAGSGVPQFSAVLDCATVGRAAGVPVIADGGIKAAGDIAEALAAGPATAMIGRLRP